MKHIFSYAGLAQKLFISLLLMAGLMLTMDFSELKGSLGVIHYDAWFLAIGCIYVQIFALSYRWLRLINVHEKKISFGYALQTNIASLLANYLFITSVGGIIVRVAMSVKSGVSLIRSIAATGLDRVFTLFALLLMTTIFLPVLGDIVTHDVYQKTLALVVVFVLGAGVLSLILLEGPRRKIIFSHRKIAMCFQYLRTVLTTRRVLAEVTISSLIGQVAYFAAAYCVLSSMGIEFSALYFMAIIPVIAVVASLPIGYGGWGIREGAFVYGLGLINVPLETAFSASIQIGLISMGAAIIAGLPALLNAKFLRMFLSGSKPEG